VSTFHAPLVEEGEVEKSLPPKHETILFTGMSVLQKKLYRDILIRDIDSLQGNSGNRTAILNIVMQLRKCAGHPYLFPGAEDRSLPPLGEHLVENCGKMVLLDKLLKRLRERGHRVLLFTQMTRILDIMEDYLVMRRFPYCRIDGNTSYEMREDYIEAFNAPNSEKFIFLLSTRAGGLGINLQTADVVILYDSDWNPQADLQAQDRAHRIGQKREVQVFRFVTEHTVEEKIVERAQQKLKLDAMVVQQGRLKDKDKKLSRDELLQAVCFGADKIFKSKDSSITDEDIDMILKAGKEKTKELNEKLKTADKGDFLDFKLDGNSNLQTFEGVDYSGGALAAAKAEAELLNIIDMGKRERRTVANYNENKLYQQQMAVNQGGIVREKKKRKIIRLPKHLRLPSRRVYEL
jgi:SWI/SNF-related matrix-associated actin-dependent regulator of chromatin subfamily A member 5